MKDREINGKNSSMQLKLNPLIIESARRLWNYLKVGIPLKPADGILIFCSNDLRVAEYAAQLYHRGMAQWICPSGGVGRLTYDLYHKPEAEAFADVLLKAGIPKTAIYIENRATNTAENIFFTRELLTANQVSFISLIILQKPYMERRTMAAVTKYWPELDFCVSSPEITFEEYPFDGFSMIDLIQVMVGDFHRIIVYAERGWQAPQPIPDYVMDAFNVLVKSGFTAQLADPAALPSTPSETI